MSMQQFYILKRNRVHGSIIQFMMMKLGSLIKVILYLMDDLLKFTNLYLIKHIFKEKLEHLFKKIINLTNNRNILKLERSFKRNIYNKNKKCIC